MASFRRYILDGLWDKAETTLFLLGVGDKDSLLVSHFYLLLIIRAHTILQEARFLISQQKYLEHLEAQNLSSALTVLRSELAVHNVDPNQLHSLSR